MGNVNRFKFVTTFFLAAWPSFAASAIAVALVNGDKVAPDVLPWAVGLALGNAAYQGLFAVNRLMSNPNKQP
jgi:hypothetical protein